WFKPSPRKSAAPRSCHPQLEMLEDRLVPSINNPFPIGSSAHDDTAPATASSTNGMRVVVWEQEISAKDRDVIAKLYDVNGQQVGGTIIVCDKADDEFGPDVSMDAQGNFVVVWTQNVQNNNTNFDVRF